MLHVCKKIDKLLAYIFNTSITILPYITKSLHFHVKKCDSKIILVS